MGENGIEMRRKGRKWKKMREILGKRDKTGLEWGKFRILGIWGFPNCPNSQFFCLFCSRGRFGSAA